MIIKIIECLKYKGLRQRYDSSNSTLTNLYSIVDVYASIRYRSIKAVTKGIWYMV